MIRTISAFLLLTPLPVGSVAAILCAGSSAAADGRVAANNLIVYPPVPGLASSDHYAVRVRPARADAPWQSAFVFKTACKDLGRYDPKNNGKINTEGYCAHLSGWSHSYVNFETANQVEVEISKVIGWRYTSDAFGAASNALVEDCFTRTNDDVIYPCGFGIRRLVIC